MLNHVSLHEALDDFQTWSQSRSQCPVVYHLGGIIELEPLLVASLTHREHFRDVFCEADAIMMVTLKYLIDCSMSMIY